MREDDLPEPGRVQKRGDFVSPGWKNFWRVEAHARSPEVSRSRAPSSPRKSGVRDVGACGARPKMHSIERADGAKPV